MMQQTKPVRRSSLDQLDEIIQQEMERARIPGLAIALVRDDEVVWSRGYGYANLESHAPFTPTTVFAIQSVTKTFIATALMQWQERGRFRLDDRVNDHLAPVRIENEWEETDPVTIRGLLTHSAGLPVDAGVAPPPDDGDGPALATMVGASKTVRRPGEEVVYANGGYDALGLLLERLSGRPWDAELQGAVLEPLGMRSSVAGRPAPEAPVARGYYFSPADGQHHHAPFDYELGSFTRPCGGLMSTAEDLARFLMAHINGGAYGGQRILQEATVQEMQRLHVPIGASDGGMGLGFRVDRTGGRRLICHGGDGFGATIFIGAYPDERAGVALLINLGRAQVSRAVIANAALRLLVGEEPEAPPDEANPPEAERIAGRYVSNFWGMTADVTVEDGRLQALVEGGIASLAGQPSLLQQLDDRRFRAHGGPFAGLELAFDFGEDGRATSFAGGLYPYTFRRRGDVPPPADLTVDQSAQLTGRWTGTVASPFGSLPLALTIVDGGATVSVLSAQDAALLECAAESGRVAGEFDVSLAGLGDFRVFLRMNAVPDGRLLGRVYARGAFGEIAMPADLVRESDNGS